MTVSFIYLAPQLERFPTEVIVGILAHEVAHAFVGIVGLETEEKAWQLAKDWGFEEEVKRAESELKAISPKES